MQLKVLTPHKIITKKNVTKFLGESTEGGFGILPRHIDFVTKILPCIFFYESDTGEGYFAVDEGILVKQQDILRISVRTAVEKKDLGELRDTMEKEFQQSEEEEKRSGMEITKLELGIVKSFYNLEQLGKE